MRSSTLIAILPLLAITAVAHPHHKQHKHHQQDKETNLDIQAVRSSRKSLGFGPTHHLATFNSIDAEHQVNVQARSEDALVAADPLQALQRLVKSLGWAGKEGEGYYIRGDSYTDSRTGVSHYYLRQIINGLEVADGDINVNVDRDGNVLSWGDSFFRGAAPSMPGSDSDADSFVNLLASRTKAANHASQCSTLKEMIKTNSHIQHKLKKALNKLVATDKHSDKTHLSVTGLVRQALAIVKETVLGFEATGPTEHDHHGKHDKKREHILAKLQKKFGVSTLEELEVMLTNLSVQLESMQDHATVLCASAQHKDVKSSLADTDDLMDGLPYHGPVKALSSALALLSPQAALLPSIEEMEKSLQVHYDATLLPPYEARAPGEPPVVVISGLPGAKEGGTVSPVKARLMYHQVNVEGESQQMDLRLVWKLELEMADNWYEASIDAQDLKVVGIVDWASDASPVIRKNKGGKQKPLPAPKPSAAPYTYTVFPFHVNDPSVGNLSSVHEPWDAIASPAGWHAFPDAANPWIKQSIPGMKTGLKGAFVDGKGSVVEMQSAYNKTWSQFGTTMGNNVFAQEDFEGANNWLHNTRPVNSSFIFDYEYGEPDGLRPKEYIDLAVTQLFYTSNMYHDLLWHLGFDEASGNFQMENFGKGGQGGDAVITQAQDGSGTNNANFMTPPDGTAPRMRMYVWDTATPYRDGDLEAGIVIHEYSHGLSTRLTGGPANSGCLGYGEAGGMGEGWGDAMATIIRQIHEYSGSTEEYGMGAWAANRKTGIRNYVYSGNFTSNPSTFKTLDKPGYWGVHAIGEVWAEMVFIVEQHLIAKHGFSKTLFPPANTTEANDYYFEQSYDVQGRPKPLVPKHGNTLTAHLLVEGMKLQPCRPSFANARDAIIQADVVLTGGNNTCDIWAAFSDRGLGPDAKVLGQLPWGGGVRSEDYTLPKICATKKPKA